MAQAFDTFPLLVAICYCYDAYMASADAGSRALSNLRLLNGGMHSLWATFPFHQSIRPPPQASFRFLSPFRVYASPHPTQRVSPKPTTNLTYSTYIVHSTIRPLAYHVHISEVRIILCWVHYCLNWWRLITVTTDSAWQNQNHPSHLKIFTVASSNGTR